MTALASPLSADVELISRLQQSQRRILFVGQMHEFLGHLLFEIEFGVELLSVGRRFLESLSASSRPVLRRFALDWRNIAGRDDRLSFSTCLQSRGNIFM